MPNPSRRQLRRMLTVEEAGFILGLSRAAAYRAASRGDLPTKRLGGRLVVLRAAFERQIGERIVLPEEDARAGP